MAILYKIVADKLDLPIVGINLPDHFILGYKDIYNHTNQDLLFYINPFSKGAVFGKGELERYIEKMQIEMHVDDLKPISNLQIIKLKLTGLKACYKKLGKYRKLDEVDQLLSIL
jgi:regulator of sirC expression with transglutaminase-like and TPR domain